MFARQFTFVDPVVAALCGLAACAMQPANREGGQPMDSLVTADWLAGQPGDPNLVVRAGGAA